MRAIWFDLWSFGERAARCMKRFLQGRLCCRDFRGHGQGGAGQLPRLCAAGRDHVHTHTPAPQASSGRSSPGRERAPAVVSVGRGTCSLCRQRSCRRRAGSSSRGRYSRGGRARAGWAGLGVCCVLGRCGENLVGVFSLSLSRWEMKLCRAHSRTLVQVFSGEEVSGMEQILSF